MSGMNGMKRFGMKDVSKNAFEPWQKLQPEPDGEWVRYEDAQKQIARLKEIANELDELVRVACEDAGLSVQNNVSDRLLTLRKRGGYEEVNHGLEQD